jgi:hypothetical protein
MRRTGWKDRRRAKVSVNASNAVEMHLFAGKLDCSFTCYDPCKIVEGGNECESSCGNR